jgi:hypothetical protein
MCLEVGVNDPSLKLVGEFVDFFWDFRVVGCCKLAGELRDTTLNYRELKLIHQLYDLFGGHRVLHITRVNCNPNQSCDGQD